MASMICISPITIIQSFLCMLPLPPPAPPPPPPRLPTLSCLTLSPSISTLELLRRPAPHTLLHFIYPLVEAGVREKHAPFMEKEAGQHSALIATFYGNIFYVLLFLITFTVWFDRPFRDCDKVR